MMDTQELDIMKLKRAFNPVNPELEQVQQLKMEVKANYLCVNAKKQFLKSLYMEPDDWLTTEEAEAELKTASTELQEIKTEMQEVKDSMLSLCESAEEGYTLLTQKKNLLKKKVDELEEKKCELEKRRTECSGIKCVDGVQGNTGQEMLANLTKKTEAMDCAIKKCSEAIDRIKSELQDVEPVIQNLEQTMAWQSQSLEKMTTKQKRRETVISQLTEQLEKFVHDVEALGGPTVVPLSQSALRVEFPTSSRDESGIQLALSLEFVENSMGVPVLSSAQVNVESLDVSDLLHAAVACNHPSALVTLLQSRWLSHQPLLSEISNLRLRSAVDWIQEENLLRVMVGNGGSIVCTLTVPPSYPMSGEITLVDIMGQGVADDVSQLKPPGYERTLTAWVDCLEAKFGRP